MLIYTFNLIYKHLLQNIYIYIDKKYFTKTENISNLENRGAAPLPRGFASVHNDITYSSL